MRRCEEYEMSKNNTGVMLKRKLGGCVSEGTWK